MTLDINKLHQSIFWVLCKEYNGEKAWQQWQSLEIFMKI